MRSGLLYVILVVMSLCVSPACKKSSGGGGGGGGGGTSEANLVVQITPPDGSLQAPSLGPFTLNVNVTSTMPPSGVKIEVSAKRDDGSGSAPFFSTSVNTSTAASTFTITNTPINVQCLVDVKVTSLTKATNVWSGSYRYSRK